MSKNRSAELMIRNSEQACYKMCRQRWWWGYVDRYKTLTPSSPLTFGTMVHAALERYYLPGKERGAHPAKIAKRLCARHQRLTGEDLPKVKIGNTDEEDSEVGYVDALELAVVMLEGYIDEYGADENYEVIASEMTYQIDIHAEDGTYLFTAVGTFDGLWRDLRTGMLLFAEHKTGSGLLPFGAPVALDEQSGGYLTFGNLFLRAQGILEPDQEVDHVLFNRLRKAFPDDRPTNELGQALNKNGSVSKRQPTPRFKREIVYRGAEDQLTLLRRWQAEAIEMQMARNGELAIIKTPDRHCGWCEYRDMCEVHECGGDWEAMASAMFTKWDPYSAHEIKQERVRG